MTWIYRRTPAKYVGSDMQQKISSVKYVVHDTGRVNRVRTGRVQFLAGAEISHCSALSKPHLGWTKPIQWVTECKMNMTANCLQHKYRGHQEQCSFKQIGTIFVIQIPDTALINSLNCKECWFVYFWLNWLLQGFQVFIAAAIDSVVVYLLVCVICWWVMVHEQSSFLFLLYNHPLPQLGSLWLCSMFFPKHWCIPTMDTCTCIFHHILPFREVFYICTWKSMLVENCWNTFFHLGVLESLCFQRFMEMLTWVEPYCWLCKVQCWMFCCRWSLATVVFCWRYRLLRVMLKWLELMQKLLKILPRFVAVLLLMCVCTVRQVAKSV